MVCYCTNTHNACGHQSFVDESRGVRKKKAEGEKRRKEPLEEGRWIGLEVTEEASSWWSNREDERVGLQRGPLVVSILLVRTKPN